MIKRPANFLWRHVHQRRRPLAGLFGYHTNYLLAYNVMPNASHESKAWQSNDDVLISTSHDVFLNLALEDWLYHNVDWSLPFPNSPMISKSMLLLWKNSPCVVIGRHQNPWLECQTLSSLHTDGVTVARRNSGGGAVYHDLGNLNCTFFTSKAAYNRKANLELICKAIRVLDHRLDVTVSSRLDILLDNYYKVSGTASKLGRSSAYHHCTVLVHVDIESLHRVLRTSDVAGIIESKATRSVKSPVKNLDGLHMEDVAQSIAKLFTRQQNRYRCTLVDPTEEQFPGITEIARQLRSWEWTFGKCPSFTLQRTVKLPKEIGGQEQTITATTDRGIIKSTSCSNPQPHLQRTLDSFTGSRFPTIDSFLEDLNCDKIDALKTWIARNCFLNIF